MNKTSKSILSNFELPKNKKAILRIPITPRKIGDTNGKVSNSIGELTRDKAKTSINEILIVKILKK